jgi:hypothetical protein
MRWSAKPARKPPGRCTRWDLVGVYQLVLPHVHFVRMTFLCEALGHDAEQPLDKEIVRTHWLTRAEIAAHAVPQRSPLVLACIDDHRAGKLWPLEQIADVVRP